MRDLRSNTSIILLMALILIINKALLRPYVLANDLPSLVKAFVLSLPNSLEAVAGTMLLCNFAIISRHCGHRWTASLSNHQIYFAVVVLAAVYVITQEFKLHNLGGRNVYDPFDVLFSVLGLLMAYGLLRVFKPQIR